MKVLVVMGTRPEVIKLAPVVAALRDRGIETMVCSTGQHRDMLEQALSVFRVKPDHRLDVMLPSQQLNSLAARLIDALDPVLAQERPDWVLVQGDTTSAFSAALAAFHRGMRVGHVEAGLRTGDLSNPFPEEANRRLVSCLATQHFAPTVLARQALLAEGVNPQAIDVTGNTVVDAIELVKSQLDAWTPPEALAGALERAGTRPVVLVTCHRRESHGTTLDAICGLFSRLSEEYANYHWVFPVHPNPAVHETAHRCLAGLDNLSLVSPVDYVSNLALMARSVLIVTDSGGIQEEAPSFGVPVVVMRSHTERREGVEAGVATLAGQDVRSIESSVREWLDNDVNRRSVRQVLNPYGDGLASQRIVTRLAGIELGGFDG